MLENKFKAYVNEGSFVARIAAKKLGVRSVAIVFGRAIHLYNVSKKDFLSHERWVLHELAHVKQYREYGFLRFIFLYMAACFKDGYYLNRFEAEAREAENNKELFNHYEIN